MNGHALLLPLLLAPAAAPAGQQGGVRLERRVEAMGTVLDLELEAADRAEALAASEAAFAALRAVEARLSTWREDSELARLNATPTGYPFRPSPELAAWLERAFHWRDLTGGAFDPSLGALVTAWDLRGAGRVPGPEELERARAACGAEAWSLHLPDMLVRRSPDVRLEEGGFGKGAGLDTALDALRKRGVRRARLDLGGQLALLGEGRPWSVELAHPDARGRALLRLELDGGSLATSGNSERGRDVGEERVGHLLDGRSGRPAPDFGSATVWTSTALDADCLSTAAFVLGPEAGPSRMAALPGVEALWILRGAERPRGIATEGLRGRLFPLDPKFEVEWIPTPSPPPLSGER